MKRIAWFLWELVKPLLVVVSFPVWFPCLLLAYVVLAPLLALLLFIENAWTTAKEKAK